ncbi:MAG: hypothetical protein N2484_02570 [Clostridia bacterium]|nr:hypothetical protein [Clostridia bacterium]
MNKLLKYEIKDIWKTVATGLIILTILNVLVFLSYQLVGEGMFSGLKVTESGFGVQIKGVVGLGMILCYLADISMVILAFIFGINIFRKDLYGDTGVMLLTVPRTGMQIVSAKLLTALLQFVIIFEISAYFLVMQTIGISKSIKSGEFTAAFWDATFGKLDAWMFFTVIFVLIFIWVIAASYLAIAFSKSFFRKKNLRWLITIGVFAGLAVIDTVVERLLEKHVPISFDPTLLLQNSSRALTEGFQIGYATLVFEALIIAAMLLGTAYLLDRKVEI